MPSSFKPAVALSKVPSVKELCERLGFQYASLKETNTFMEVTRAWRKSCTTSSGRHASDLLNWNDPLDQLDLKEMAEKFLDTVEDGKTYGERFWSPARSWNHDSELEFPEDKSRIVELLKQLFWRQNRYAYNNSHYGHRDTEPSRDTSRDVTTPLRQTGPEMYSAPPTADASGRTKPNSPRTFSSRPKANHMTQTSGNSSTGQVDAPGRDIFEFPSDSDSHQDPMRHKRPPAHSNTGGTPPKKKIKTKNAATPRRTDRKRMTRNIPDKASEDEVHQIIDLSSDEVTPDDRPGNVQSAETPIVPMPMVSSPSSTPKRYAPTAPMLDKRKSVSPKSKGSKIAQDTNPIDPSKSSTSSSSPPHSSSATKKTKVVKLPLKPSPYISPYVEDEPVISPVATKESMHARPGGVPHRKPPGYPAQGSDASDPVLPQSKPHVGEQRVRPQTTIQTEDRISAPPAESVPVWQTTFQNIEPMYQNPPKISTAESITASSSASTPAPPPRKPEKPEPAPPSPPQIPPSKPRQKIQIPLWIITREPRYTEERWDDGKFMGTPLASFIEGISKVTQRSHIEKIKLTLRAPTFDTKITVFKDAEDSWASAKETFVEKLKEAKAEGRARRQEQVSFKILVEPFYEEGFIPSGSVDEDEEEFEF